MRSDNLINIHVQNVHVKGLDSIMWVVLKGKKVYE